MRQILQQVFFYPLSFFSIHKSFSTSACIIGNYPRSTRLSFQVNCWVIILISGIHKHICSRINCRKLLRAIRSGDTNDCAFICYPPQQIYDLLSTHTVRSHPAAQRYFHFAVQLLHTPYLRIQ